MARENTPEVPTKPDNDNERRPSADKLALNTTGEGHIL